MEFWVVVCSKCKWARGARSTSKRVRCTRCGATIEVRLAQPFGKSMNELDLAKAVGAVNEKLHRKGRKPAHTKSNEGIQERQVKGSTPRTRDDRGTIMELANSMKEFSFDDVLMALAGTRLVQPSEVDRDEATKAINDLLTKGYIFEYKANHYKIV